MNNTLPHNFSQTKDYPIDFTELPKVYLRYLYSRSNESRTSGSKGQDYLAVRYTDEALLFVICDGVSGSFCGDIAARYLGEQLIRDDFLLNDVMESFNEVKNRSELEGEIREYLNWLQMGGQKITEKEELPSNLPSLQLQALQDLKNNQGSETVFVCGRLSFADSPQLILIWMGDSEVRLFNQRGDKIPITSRRWDHRDRWSTKYGANKPGAKVHAEVFTGNDIGRIVAFSDGLSAVRDTIETLQDDALQEKVGELLMSPLSDDISFFDICLKHVSGQPTKWKQLLRVQPSPLSAPELHDLASPSIEYATPYTLSWEEVPGAQYYLLIEKSDAEPHPQIYIGPEQEHTIAQRPPGRYRYWVRACGAAGEGENSQSRSIVIEPPPAPDPQRTAPLPPLDQRQIPVATLTELQQPTLNPLKPVAVNENYTISWSEVPGAEEYHLGIATSSILAQSGLCQVIGKSPDTTIVTSRDQAGTYYYRVKAVRGSQESEWSNIEAIEVSTPQISTPPVSTPPVSTPPVSTPPVSTPPPKQEGDEDIKIKIVHSTAFEDAQKKGTKTGQAATSVGVQPDGTGQPATSVTRLDRPKLDPIGAVWVNQPYDLRWSPVTGATRYELGVAESDILSQSGIFDLIGRTQNTTYTINHDSPRTVYYRVRALNDSHESEWSEPEAATVKSTVKLKVPILRVAQAYNDASVKINWSLVPGADRYELQEAKINKLMQYSPIYPYRDVSTGQSCEIKDTEITLSNRDPGIYAYRVRACNANDCSKYSQEKRVEVKKPLPLPEAPYLYSIQNPDNNNGYTVRWEYVNKATGYILYEARTPDFSDQKQVYYDRSRFIYLDDKEPGIYYYRVFAYNKQGQYDPNKSSRTVPTQVVLKTPQWQKADVYPKNQETGLKLWWGYVTGAVKYEVMKVKTREIYDSSYKKWKLRPVFEGTYEFRVRAISSGGWEGEWSDTIEVTITRNRYQQLTCTWTIKK